MNAEQLLAQYGISFAEARDWIMAHIDSPGTIYSVAKSYGVTSAHLAELVDHVYPGVSAGEVEQWFSAQGYEGAALQAYTEELQALISDDLIGLVSAMFSLNEEDGLLSTATLRAGIIAETGADAYNDFFAVDGIAGADDGWFGADDIGLPGFEGFEATVENVESLYYGSLINAFKAIDQQEVTQLYSEIEEIGDSLATDPQALAEFTQMLIGVFEDPAANPIMSDQLIYDTIISATVTAVGYSVEGADLELFGSLIYAV